MPVVTMKDLLEAGVHFGHQTRRWNPKMKRYIFTERNGIYIVDLQKTLKQIEDAYRLVKETIERGEMILFIGTKKQAAPMIVAETGRCGMPYVSERWLGGMLTNFKTIRESIKRLDQLDKMSQDGTYASLPKKEVLRLERERAKLQKTLGGIRKTTRLPGLLFVIDAKKERIAIAEANKLGIPVIAILDTNCDPDVVTCPIPGNDDAIRSISLITRVIADAVIEAQNGAMVKESHDTSGWVTAEEDVEVPVEA
jgi:small subunit ribosomal protein S2